MREKIILQNLIQSKRYISAEEFSKILDVSTRTVRSHMKTLMEDGRRYGFSVNMKRGEGYYLKVEDEVKLKKYMDSLYDHMGSDREGRLNAIIKELITTDGFITMDKLSNDFMVSKSVVKSDLEKIEESFNESSIYLERKAHYGIKIIGKEEDIREFILKLCLSENEMILKIINEEEYNKDFQIIEKSIIASLKNNQLVMNDVEIKSLMLFLKIMLFRNKYFLEKGNEEINCINDDYDFIAHEMITNIERLYSIALSQKDEFRLKEFLKHKASKKCNDEISLDKLKERIERFLESIDKEYKTKFSLDEHLKGALLFHISSLIQRLKDNVEFLNPIVNEISYKYPEMFNVAIRFTKELEREYKINITKDEIGYLTMHLAAHMEKSIKDKINKLRKIAVICSSGGGVAFLIKIKLESLFNNANIKTFSLLDMEEVKEFDPNIIFSISKLKEDLGVPVIYINELLEDEDLLKIKETLELKLYRGEDDGKETIWEKLLSKNIYFVEEKKKDYEKILKSMAKRVEEFKYAEKGYLKKVIERENVLSTIYKNGIAIPHPMEMCGAQNKIAVTILKDPIIHDDKIVKIIFMVSLKKGELELHKVITKLLLNLMDSKERIERVVNSSSYEDFIIEMNNLILVKE